MGAEVSALQVQLKREQLKVQSLEKNLEQKVPHCAEMTKPTFTLMLDVASHECLTSLECESC